MVPIAIGIGVNEPLVYRNLPACPCCRAVVKSGHAEVYVAPLCFNRPVPSR